MLLKPRPRLSDEGGFTIVELLLACSIGLLILGSATMITIGAARHNGEVANRTDATQRGRSALELLQRDIRSQVCTTTSAYPISVAKPTQITYTNDLTGGVKLPVRHTVTFDATKRTLTDSYVQGAGSPLAFTATAKTKVLATDVERQGTGSVFRYYAFPSPPPSSGIVEPNIELVPTSAGLSAADLGRVARVDIAFRTSGATRETRDITADMSDTVFVRIADPNDAAGAYNPTCLT